MTHLQDTIPCEICDILIPVDMYLQHAELHSGNTHTLPILSHVYSRRHWNLPDTNIQEVININEMRDIDETTDNYGISQNSDDNNNINQVRPNSIIMRNRRRNIRRNRVRFQEGVDVNIDRFTQDGNISQGNLRRFLAIYHSHGSNDDSYEMNTRLSELIGNVEKGIENINTVSKIYKFHECDTNRDIHCSICLNEFSKNTLIRKLKCTHVFCVHCINKWLEKSVICKKDLGEKI